MSAVAITSLAMYEVLILILAGDSPVVEYRLVRVGPNSTNKFKRVSDSY